MILTTEDELKSLKRTGPDCEARQGLNGSNTPQLAAYRRAKHLWDIPLVPAGRFI